MADITGTRAKVELANGFGVNCYAWSASDGDMTFDMPLAFGENVTYSVPVGKMFSGSFRGKLQKGATSGSNGPPIPWVTQNTSFILDTTNSGFYGAATFTSDTGCTYSGTFIWTVSIEHSKTDAPIVSGSFKNANTSITVAWSTS